MVQGEKSPNSRWVGQLFEFLNLPRGSAVSKVLEVAEETANRLAPDTRRLLALITVLQGVAVVIPLFWLLVVPNRWPVSYIAIAAMMCSLLVISVCWWMRWRGMQHTWVRSRMLAEIARSSAVTSKVVPDSTALALSGAPSLQSICGWFGEEATPTGSLSERIAGYRSSRIEDQLDYYRRKGAEAEIERKKLSRTVTISLDAALFLAVAGLAISIKDEAYRWLEWSGSDYMLGFVGSALPLMAILAQLRASYLELNRRVGRYAQQIEFLTTAESELDGLKTEEEFAALVTGVERTLLGEVVDWFYQAEHSEPFYRSKGVDFAALRGRIGPRGILDRVLSGLGVGAGFLGRVVIGRVVVVALSVVVTTALMHYKRTPEVRLGKWDGAILKPVADGGYGLWESGTEQEGKGLILIVHGLNDGVDLSGGVATEKVEDRHWMTLMETRLRGRLKGENPDVCLVDWSGAANPSGREGDTLDSMIDLENEAGAMTKNLGMIRPQGEKVGELVGRKLFQAIEQGRLDPRDPIHLIGHSAGGFVVVHVAKTLSALGVEFSDLRITMLDTPLPVKDDLMTVLDYAHVDFYCTSLFAKGVPDSGFHERFTRFDLVLPANYDSFLQAHFYAFEWFNQSIVDGDARGFARSPFANEAN